MEKEIIDRITYDINFILFAYFIKGSGVKDYPRN